MQKLRITPTKLYGKILVPSSKSMGHREIICAGLSRGKSLIDNISISKDIEATVRCLTAMGVCVEERESNFAKRTAFSICSNGKPFAKEKYADCGESGSTLRFFIPLAATLNQSFRFEGHGKLVSRPLQVYYDIFDRQGLRYETSNGKLPLTVDGKLRSGKYIIPGNISSQYISGLLFTLPLLDGDSEIEIEGRLESASYIDMTINCLKSYGVEIENNNYRNYVVKGKQKYICHNSIIEGDWSQAAFWIVASAIGNEVKSAGIELCSMQGDKAIISILQKMGINFKFDGNEICVKKSQANGITIDVSDCPDLVPILAAFGAVSNGNTEIINAGRLRLKECDRLSAVCNELNKLGAEVKELSDGLIIVGHPEGLKGNVEVDAWNDHRIAMCLAIAATKCKEPIILTGAESVSKSYPTFWEDYTAVGGRIEVVQ